MLQSFKNFRSDEDGAVTTDWVVLTAAIVILAFTIGTMIRDATIDTGGRVEQTVMNVQVN